MPCGVAVRELKMQTIWFSERLELYRWVLHLDGAQEHYSGNATSMEQVIKDIEICKAYHETSCHDFLRPDH
jgi:hypothetical protein